MIERNRVYLAARYSRFPEMQGYRAQLAEIGLRVQARWVDGEHEKVDGIATHEQAAGFADDDVADLLGADIVISFTEDPEGPHVGRARGGRHVEFGMAWAARRFRRGTGQTPELFVVGHRENVFHHLPEVKFFDTWPECLAFLRGRVEALRGPQAVPA